MAENKKNKPKTSKKIENKKKKVASKKVATVKKKTEASKKTTSVKKKAVPKKVVKKSVAPKKKVVKKEAQKSEIKQPEPKVEVKKVTPVKKLKNPDLRGEREYRVDTSQNVKEPWYVWLKDNMVEDESKVPEKTKKERLKVTLFIIFCFFSVLFSTMLIDYSYATSKGISPLFVIRSRNEYEQATLYYGLFYKAWKCDNGDENVSFVRYSDPIGYCEVVPEYDKDGIYTNPNNIKITENQMNIIKDYYFNDYMYFKNQKEVEDAYKISMAINKVWYVIKENTVISNEPEAKLAIFGKLETINGKTSWQLQYEDPKYHKCVKRVENNNVVADYNESTNKCGNNWETMYMDSESCELAKSNTTFIKELIGLSEFCK